MTTRREQIEQELMELQDQVAKQADIQADNLQRREYAKAALTGLLASCQGTHHDESSRAHLVAMSFDFSDFMLAEQKKREAAE